MICRRVCSDWLSPAALVEQNRLFDDAEKSVADQPTLLARVTRERLPVTLAMLQNDRNYRRLAQKEGVKWPTKEESLALAYAWRQRCLDEQTNAMGEGNPFVNLETPIMSSISREVAPSITPEACRNLPMDRWRAWGPDEWTLAGVGKWVFHEKDGDVDAQRMPGTMSQWAVQKPLDELAGDTCHLYVVARVETLPGAASDQPALQLGVYDGPGGHSLGDVLPTIAQVGDGRYHVFDLGRHKATIGAYVWVAPPVKTDAVKSVWVSQIYAVED